MKNLLFQHKDVTRIFPNLKTRTLISWSEKGLFKPEVEPPGTGYRRKYSEKNLVEIGVIRELVSLRIPHDMIKYFIRELNKEQRSKKKNYDMVLVLRRQYSPGTGEVIGWVEEPCVGSRSKFGEEAAGLIFGERPISYRGMTGKSREIAVGSAIVVSVADIWEFIEKRL